MKWVRLETPSYYGKHLFGTKRVTEDGDIFDLTTTGCAWGRKLLADPKFYKETENLTFEFVMMSPSEYYEICSKEIYFDDVEETKHFKGVVERDKIEILKDVIRVQKRKFPVTYIDYTRPAQEGYHRMYAAAELYG